MMNLSNNPGATQRIRPPRWTHVRFPRGSMLGEPGNHDKQRSVLTDTLRALAVIDTPGWSVELPYRWGADSVTWRGKPLRESSYS
jgi:hypothetical protein